MTATETTSVVMPGSSSTGYKVRLVDDQAPTNPNNDGKET
jgi:hypothetical protein